MRIRPKRLVPAIVLLFLAYVPAFGASCPAGSTQLTSTTTGGHASSPETWGGATLGTGDGKCLILEGPVVIDQDLGTSGGTGVYTIIQDGSGSLLIDSSATRHIYFASTGADPLGSGSPGSPGPDATMYGFFFPSGTLSLTGTQAHPVIIDSADGSDPWYIAGATPGLQSFSVTIKWCDCSHLGTDANGFYGVDVDTSAFSGQEVIDIENSRFTSPHQVLYVYGNNLGPGRLTVAHNIVTRRHGPATIQNPYGLLVSPLIQGNTESAPAAPGAFAYIFSISGSSTVYAQNAVAGTAAAAIGNLVTNATFSGSGVVQYNLTWNDPAQAGATDADGFSLVTDSSFTGPLDSNYCEGCNQSIAIRGSSPAAEITVSNNFGVTSHLAVQGQGIYFVQGGSATLSRNIGVFTDATVGPPPPNCIFGYSLRTVLTALNNTCHSVVGPGSYDFGIEIGEPGYPASAALVAYNLISGFAYGIVDGDSGNQYGNSWAGAGVHHNDVWNAGNTYQAAASSRFDNGSQPHPNALYGDLTVDPGFLDPTRLSLADYDAKVLGGPGTVSDLITRIGYRSGWGGAYQLGPSPIADALSWFRNGFTSSNAAVCPGGVATGAMPCAGTTLTLSPPTLPSGTQGVSYSQALSVSGGLNCTFSAAGALPPGLALTFTGTSNTASLSGIPSAPGSYSFALDAVCLNGSAGTSATIDVTLPSQQTDFTSQVRFTLPGLVFSRFTNIFSGSVTATNIGSTTIAAPLQLVFSNLGAGVTVANQTGTVPGGSYAGAPYITAAGNSPLAPGASVTFPVRVSDPNHVPISYVPRILSGAF